MNKRIIPCLDVKEGRVVKGKKFQDIKDVANPVELAKKYELERADNLFLLDITGDDRASFVTIVKSIAEKIEIPLYVGGGNRSADDGAAVLDAGPAKASITSAAIENREIVKDAADNLWKAT